MLVCLTKDVSFSISFFLLIFLFTALQNYCHAFIFETLITKINNNMSHIGLTDGNDYLNRQQAMHKISEVICENEGNIWSWTIDPYNGFETTDEVLSCTFAEDVVVGPKGSLKNASVHFPILCALIAENPFELLFGTQSYNICSKPVTKDVEFNTIHLKEGCHVLEFCSQLPAGCIEFHDLQLHGLKQGDVITVIAQPVPVSIIPADQDFKVNVSKGLMLNIKNGLITRDKFYILASGVPMIQVPFTPDLKDVLNSLDYRGEIDESWTPEDIAAWVYSYSIHTTFDSAYTFGDEDSPMKFSSNQHHPWFQTQIEAVCGQKILLPLGRHVVNVITCSHMFELELANGLLIESVHTPVYSITSDTFAIKMEFPTVNEVVHVTVQGSPEEVEAGKIVTLDIEQEFVPEHFLTNLSNYSIVGIVGTKFGSNSYLREKYALVHKMSKLQRQRYFSAVRLRHGSILNKRDKDRCMVDEQARQAVSDQKDAMEAVKET